MPKRFCVRPTRNCGRSKKTITAALRGAETLVLVYVVSVGPSTPTGGLLYRSLSTGQ